MKMTRFPGNYLDVVSLVVLLVVQVSNPLLESIFVLVTEWISSKDMVNLYELSSTLYVVLQEWLGNEILDALGDQTWIDMSEEWAEFMYGEGNSPARKKRKEERDKVECPSLLRDRHGLVRVKI